MTDDIKMRCLQDYYKRNGTINDIDYDYVTVFEGKRIELGLFLSKIRNDHKKYISSKGQKMPTSLILTRFKKLELMGFNWEKSQIKRASRALEDAPIRYLRKHFSEHGTINDIEPNEEIEFEGNTISIGKYLCNISYLHSAYLRGSTAKSCSTAIAKIRYSILDDMRFEWDNEKRKAMQLVNKDIKIRYLRHYYKEHGTINDIPTTTIVEFDGQEVRIGDFLLKIRSKHKRYLNDPSDNYGSSEMSKARYKILDEMNFIWDVSLQIEEDPYIAYLRYHYEKHGTINNIKTRDVVMFNGKKLEIGDFISKMRSFYNNTNSQESSGLSELTKRRCEVLNELGLDWAKNKRPSLSQIARDNNIHPKTFTNMVKAFNGDVEKAIRINQSLQRIKKEKTNSLSDEYTLKSLFQEFEMDFEAFFENLNKGSLRTEPKESPLVYDEAMSLKEFCLQNGYNYEIISKAVRLKKDGLCDESFESLINRCVVEAQIKDQNYISNWIYSKYGNAELIKFLLSSNKIDAKKILSDMSKNAISLDKAIEYETFRKNIYEGSGYLEGVYHDYVTFYRTLIIRNEYTSDTILPVLNEYRENLAAEYHLTSEEIEIITAAFNKYRNISHQYRLFDVGFEKDEDKQVEKIISYGLSDKDIEEAYFMPLKFEKRILVGRNKELYNRRVMLMNLTLSWHTLGNEEKTTEISKHQLREEELAYIKSSRQSLDEIKAKVYQKN